jgi:tight adherence protein C
VDVAVGKIANWFAAMSWQLISAGLAFIGTLMITFSVHLESKYHRRISRFFINQPGNSAISNLQSQLATKLPNREVIANKILLTQSAMTLKQLRASQLSFGLIGLLAAVVINLITMSEPKLIFLAMLPLLFWAGWMLPMSQLNSKYQKLRNELNFGFAEVVDLIALCVAAGSSLSAALIQVSEVINSPWQNQLTAIRLDLAAGLSAASSLQRAATRLQHPTFTKFVSVSLITLERGTPLSAQLRIQANEISELLRRDLMAAAAKKEAVMLLPVVFLILPTIVVATLFPGVLALGNLI